MIKYCRRADFRAGELNASLMAFVGKVDNMQLYILYAFGKYVKLRC